jgi:hypothetical protein
VLRFAAPIIESSLALITSDLPLSGGYIVSQYGG